METEIIAYKLGGVEWEIEPASPKREWMNNTGPFSFAYRCLPLTIANQLGWIMKCPVDFSAVWDGKDGRDAIGITFSDPNFSNLITSHFGYGIITFQFPYLFRTNKGISLLVRGPTNYYKDNVCFLDGIIETDWSIYTWTYNIKFVSSDRPIFFRKGDPFCMIQPYALDILEDVKAVMAPISDNKELESAFRKWELYRSEFNNKPGRKGEEWQKDYMKGRKCPVAHSGGQEVLAENHKTAIKLPAFAKKPTLL